ncbi:MAG: hypothetical protein M1470_14690 [Bacteroidetes bacterium]|nr:hypothetical protein [Bacteroidota bacterium]MCL5738368.1 hypothetical protein [Bacteroidota bacterium]
MRVHNRKAALGITTDEQAMFDLLAKFLTKEGYGVRRVLPDVSENQDLALIIYAPTRELSSSTSWFKNLKNKKPALLVVQCCNENSFDAPDIDDNVIVLSEYPLNLKQLRETVVRILQDSGYEGVRLESGEFTGEVIAE